MIHGFSDISTGEYTNRLKKQRAPGLSQPLDQMTKSEETWKPVKPEFTADVKPTEHHGIGRFLGGVSLTALSLMGITGCATAAPMRQTLQQPVQQNQDSTSHKAGKSLHDAAMDAKKAGQQVGQAGKEVGLEIGKTGKDVGLAVGHKGKEVGLQVAEQAKPAIEKGKEVGQQIGKTGKEVGQEIGKAGKKFGLDVAKEAKGFWKGLTGH